MTPTPLFSDLFALDDIQPNPNNSDNFLDNDSDDNADDNDNADDKDPSNGPDDSDDSDDDAGDGSDSPDGDDDNDNDGADNGISEYQAFHDILASDGLIDPIENYDGSKEMLEAHLQTLPEQYFLQAVSEIAKPIQPLMQYVFTKGAEASIDDAYRFFEKYVVPANNLESLDIENEEVAYEYLKGKLSTLAVFKNPDKLVSHLDGLAVDGSLVDIAKEQYTIEQKEIDAAAKAEVDAANAKKLEEQEKSKKMGESVVAELKNLPWHETVKSKTLESLKPAKIQETYAAIYQNPKAILQLGAFFANFDPKTGVFDLTTYAKQVASASVEKQKSKIEKSTLDSHLNRVAKTQKGGSKSSARLYDDLVEQ